MKTKYPRTFHLPYSLTVSGDDKRLLDDSQFLGMEVVVTEKKDGENTTVYANGDCHARSLDGFGKPWQTWLLRFVQSWCYEMPDSYRVCGEDLYARHSIAYRFKNAVEYFQVFGVYNDEICLSWDDVETFCFCYNLVTVPVIYRGIYDKDAIMTAYENFKFGADNEVEGFVVRNAKAFDIKDFSLNVAKFVRANHVQTDEHWTKNWVKNEVVS